MDKATKIGGHRPPLQLAARQRGPTNDAEGTARERGVPTHGKGKDRGADGQATAEPSP
jgi:hypothetical protein